MKILTKHEERLKIYRDNYNTLEYAKKEGREEGIKEGIKLGEEKGRKDERILMAKGLKKNGMAVELIASLTGMSEAETEHLKA